MLSAAQLSAFLPYTVAAGARRGEGRARELKGWKAVGATYRL